MFQATQYVPVSAIHPRHAALVSWERKRNRQLNWFVECVAEAVCSYLLRLGGTRGSQRVSRLERSSTRSLVQVRPPHMLLETFWKSLG